MLEKLVLAGILTFTLSLFTQVQRSSSVAMTQQINSYYKAVLTFNQPPAKKLKTQNVALTRKEGSKLKIEN